MHVHRWFTRSLPLAALLVSTPVFAQQTRQDRERRAAVPELVQGSQAARFGVQQQWVFSSDAGLSIANTSLSGRGGSTTTIQLRPSVDYFVIDNLSVGGFLGLDYAHMPIGSTTVFSVGPRVGYDIPFSGAFSVWPRLGLSFAHTRQTVEDVIDGDDTTSSSGLALNISAPVMFHPTEHFFVGFGPAFDVDVTGDVKATTIAARLTIGGWL